MPTLAFFDVSVAGRSNHVRSGSVLPIGTFVSMALGAEHDRAREFSQLVDRPDFDVYGIRKPSIWEKLVSTVILCLSGQVPDSQELLRGRQIIHRLPTWFKKRHLNKQFVLCFLPYVLIGFKTHLESRFHPDSNVVDDVCKFIVHLFESEHGEIMSYLCAHRALSSVKQHSLIATVHLEKATRTLNLEMALLQNARHLKSRRILWYQQGPTAMASSNMFPEMFIRYLVDGTIPDMLLLLAEHYRDLEALMARCSSESIALQLANLDEVSIATHCYLEREFGCDWKAQTFEISHPSGNPLIKIAVEQVMPVVQRMIPFYGQSIADNFIRTRDEMLVKNAARAREIQHEDKLPHIIARTRESIEWFYNNQLMHISAKALYEAAFFYSWGCLVASDPKRIAIGIDRDHAQYQHSAWMMGYRTTLSPSKEPTAVIYSRRNSIEKAGSVLNDISFRQFWR